VIPGGVGAPPFLIVQISVGFPFFGVRVDPIPRQELSVDLPAALHRLTLERRFSRPRLMSIGGAREASPGPARVDHWGKTTVEANYLIARAG